MLPFVQNNHQNIYSYILFKADYIIFILNKITSCLHQQRFMDGIYIYNCNLL